MRPIVLLTPLVFLLALPLAWGEGDEPAYPTGRSTQEMEGLKVELGVPEGLTKEKPGSMVVILHGSGGSATGMAAALREWIPLGYVVCAPKSSGQIWTTTDVEKVKTIIQTLQAALPIDKRKLHVVGYSNGGWNLNPLAFDDDLKPRTATWVASGYRGGKPPKWASEMGVLALAGARDANAKSAQETVELLHKHVGVVEARFQPRLDHAWPTELVPYLRWWMGAREGRCVPGEDMNFSWGADLQRAITAAGGQKKGGVFVYAYDSEIEDLEDTRMLQCDVFMDPLVRHYGGQLHPTKLDAKEHRAALEALGVESFPAVVVLKQDGKPRKILQGKTLTERKITSALRSAAPDRKKPEGY